MEIDILLRELREADGRQDWAEVIRLAREILTLQPDHPHAKAFLQVAELRLERSERVSGPAAVPAQTEGFVGRVQEMAKLQRALEEACGGAGRVTALVGELLAGGGEAHQPTVCALPRRPLHLRWR